MVLVVMSKKMNDSLGLNRREILIVLFSVVLIFILAGLASAGDVRIVDIYSDIESADVTLHSDRDYTNVTIDADLIFGGDVLKSKEFIIEEALPDTDITKVAFWNIDRPGDGFYIVRMTLFVGGRVLEREYYNFSYGWSIQEIPKVFIKDISSDSSGVSVILRPNIPRIGSEQEFVLADVEYMLVDEDTVIYKTTDRRVTVVQATTLSKNWNVRLENNNNYSTRVKVRISLPRKFGIPPGDTVIAGSEDFTAMDDARITELYKDETGASATVLGLSQVPFTGEIVFTVSKDGGRVEEIRERSPILMLEDDETIEVTWNKRLSAGLYELSVTLLGNDGDVVDVWDTIIEAEEKKGENESAVPIPTETPGCSVYLAGFAIMVVYLLIGLLNRETR